VRSLQGFEAATIKSRGGVQSDPGEIAACVHNATVAGLRRTR
jgi:hypothetical protein